MRKYVIAALMVSLTACQPDTKNMERKIDDLTKQVAAINAKLDRGGAAGAGAAAGQQRQAREEADPNAVFAVDISQNLKKGQIEGPSTALVTIVEAWDFA